MTIAPAELTRFTGPVITSAEFLLADVPSGATIGCIGTDGPMLEVVASLATHGHTVRVFEDRPRRILPRRSGIRPRPAEVLAALGSAVGLIVALAPTPLPTDPVDRCLAAVRRDLDGRSAARFLAREVRDRWTRRQLTPSRFDQRRTLRHDHYLAAFGAPTCTLVSWPIASVTEAGVRTCDGIEHRLGLIISAT